MTEFKNITPDRFRCGISNCSSIHQSKDGKTLVIISKWVTEDQYPFIRGKVGLHEWPIEISTDLVLEALNLKDQCGQTEELPSGSDNASPATLRQPDTNFIPEAVLGLASAREGRS